MYVLQCTLHRNVLRCCLYKLTQTDQPICLDSRQCVKCTRWSSQYVVSRAVVVVCKLGLFSFQFHLMISRRFESCYYLVARLRSPRKGGQATPRVDTEIIVEDFIRRTLQPTPSSGRLWATTMIIHQVKREAEIK